MAVGGTKDECLCIEGVQIPYRRDHLRHLQPGPEQIRCPIHPIKETHCQLCPTQCWKVSISGSANNKDRSPTNDQPPPPVPVNDPEADDLIIIREELVRAVVKRRITLNQYLKKGFATVYDQCSQEVRDKLESSDG